MKNLPAILRLKIVVGYLFMMLVLLIFTQNNYAQEISSGKSTIFINNYPVETFETPDTTPPEIKFISPEITSGEPVKSKEAEITFIAKISDNKSGINRIIFNSEKYPLPEDGLFVQKVLLKKGINNVQLTVVDNEDNYSNINVKVEYASKSQIKTSQFTVDGKYYALIIGIDQYKDPKLTNLDNPVNDAQSLYKILESEYYFDKENIFLLKNATRADITNSLDILAEKVTPEDNLLIFYAGHGWWDEQADIGYWLPTDARLSRKAEWFRNSTLCDYLKEIKSKHTLLIADACFGGAIFKTRSVSMEAPKAIQMLYDLPSRKAMTSGTLTEVPDRSSFVKFLINRLSENDNDYISSEQLFSSFRIAVINNSDVIPQYGEIKNVGDEGGDFIFIKREK